MIGGGPQQSYDQTPPADVLIVGAGQAGAQAAISLRQGGFAGSIAMIGAEPDLPYERPPLSKDYLAGTKEASRLLLRPAAFWAEREVAMRLSERVVAVSAEDRTVTTDSGAVLGFRHLIWAAGGHPRPLPLPGADLAGVHMIRTRADTDALSADLADATSVAIVGGGYIGLEAAAVLRAAGKQVTIIEAQSRVLARVTAEPVSRFYEAEHRARGVEIALDAAIAGLSAKNKRVAGIIMGDGRTVPADVVIVGIGLLPHQAVLAEAGADCDNGVIVDEFCRTSLPDVFAIGDCAAYPNPFAHGGRVRLESVQNAVDQAKTVASAILGDPQPYRALPWFWSDQYDLKLQTVGLHGGHDEIVLRGDVTMRSFSVIYLRDGKVIALDCINAVKDFMAGKQLVAAAIQADRRQLSDLTMPLKTLLAPPAN